MVQLLLEHGANVDAGDKRDRRALHWAALMGHTDVVVHLLRDQTAVDCTDRQVS